MELRNKHIWLIGASEGIGRALALELAREGAHMHVSARKQERLDSLVAQMAGEGHSAHAFDVTDVAATKAAYGAIKTTTSDCDMVVFNAGTYTPMPIDKWDMDACKQTMDVNFNGVLHMLDAVLADLKEKRRGTLVLVSSVAGYRGLPKSLAYGASKAALTNLAESLRIELAPYNIKIQIVSPGFVKTRLTDQNDFDMPLAITADKAAEKIAAGIKAGSYDIHFPKAFTWFMKFLRILPNPIYFALARKL